MRPKAILQRLPITFTTKWKGLETDRAPKNLASIQLHTSSHPLNPFSLLTFPQAPHSMCHLPSTQNLSMLPDFTYLPSISPSGLQFETFFPSEVSPHLPSSCLYSQLFHSLIICHSLGFLCGRLVGWCHFCVTRELKTSYGRVLIYPRVTCTWMSTTHIGWTLPHQSLIMKMPSQIGQSYSGFFFQLWSCLLRQL